jgi:hypothetical protein
MKLNDDVKYSIYNDMLSIKFRNIQVNNCNQSFSFIIIYGFWKCMLTIKIWNWHPLKKCKYIMMQKLDLAPDTSIGYDSFQILKK